MIRLVTSQRSTNILRMPTAECGISVFHRKEKFISVRVMEEMTGLSKYPRNDLVEWSRVHLSKIDITLMKLKRSLLQSRDLLFFYIFLSYCRVNFIMASMRASN